MENKIGKTAKQIITIAFPVIIQGLVFQMQSLTDKAFLGNLDAVYISALGAAQFPLNTTLDSVVALGTGITIIASRLYGATKKENAIATVKSTLVYNTVIAVLLFILWFWFARPILQLLQVDNSIIAYSISYVKICAPYFLFLGIDSSLQAMLQGLGNTKPIMYAGITKVVLNILVSWVLIYGKFGFPALQMEGAAIGTLVANMVSVTFIMIYCFFIKRNSYQLHGKETRWLEWKSYKEVIQLGLPTAMEFLLWNTSNLILIRFLNGFSYMATTIYTLTFGIEVIVYAVFNGVSKATLTMMGQKIGAGDSKMANGIFKISLFMNSVLVGISILIFIGFARPILTLFTKDVTTVEQTVPFLIVTGIIMIPKSLNVIIGSAIRAYQDTKFMLCSQIIGSIFVVSCSFLLVQVVHMHMTAIYITLFLDEAIRATINYCYYKKHYVA